MIDTGRTVGPTVGKWTVHHSLGQGLRMKQWTKESGKEL